MILTNKIDLVWLDSTATTKIIYKEDEELKEKTRTRQEMWFRRALSCYEGKVMTQFPALRARPRQAPTPRAQSRLKLELSKFWGSYLICKSLHDSKALYARPSRLRGGLGGVGRGGGAPKQHLSAWPRASRHPGMTRQALRGHRREMGVNLAGLPYPWGAVHAWGRPLSFIGLIDVSTLEPHTKYFFFHHLNSN